MKQPLAVAAVSAVSASVQTATHRRGAVLVVAGALLFLVPPGFAKGRPVLVPELQIRVVDHDTGEPAAGVEIDLVVRAKRASPLARLAQATTQAEGTVHFRARSLDDLAFVGLLVGWPVPDRPHRGFLYELRAKKGKKTPDGRWMRPGQAQASYLLDGNPDGDCSNLFTLEASKDRLELIIRRPATYAACAKTAFEHADFNRIGYRDLNAGTLNFFSFDRDVELGREFVSGLGPEHPPLGDPLVERYVTDVVTHLGRASDLPELEFRVQVIDADVLNAFALPGGYLFVYRGLIAATDTESELVGVLAHEIAHVTSRHGTEGLTSGITKVLSALAIGSLLAHEVTDDDTTRNLIMGTVLTGTNFWVLGGTRKREAEADRLGAQYALRAGYDPRGLATFFGKLAASRERQPNRLDTLFSDHPSDEARVRNVEEMTNYFLPPPPGPTTSSPQYLEVKRRLAELPPPKQSGEAVANALFSSLKSANEALLWREIVDYVTPKDESEDEGSGAQP